jgi:hypothetical protein
MKKSVLMFAYILALALTATAAIAQEEINFADLPLVATPAPLPAGYEGLHWTNLFYVDPNQYAGAGLGYKNMFTHRDVAFIGGTFCAPVGTGCYGIITSSPGPISFQAASAIMAAGYQANQVRVSAYRNGTYVGSIVLLLGTTPHKVIFPASWGGITELQISTNDVGNLVLFDLSIYRLGG